MQNDDVVWSTINKNFCSYKVSTATQKFCRNEYNLTGLCSRLVCPIANSQYATVREEKGIIYLFLKTAERAAFPNKTWERIKLSRNLNKAVQQINENLLYWSGFIKSKCKQRFVKITQYLIRMRDLKLKNKKEIIPIQSKVERRTRRKEQKALGVAKFNKVTEKALLERFKQGVYEDLYNINETAFDNFLNVQEVESEVEEDEDEEPPVKIRNTGEEFIPADSDDEEIEDEDDAMSVDSESGVAEEVDVDSDFETDQSDIEDIPVLNIQKSKKSKEVSQTSQEKRPRRSKVSIEYEYETEAPEREKLRK